MSTLALSSIQIGISGTTNNNFVLLPLGSGAVKMSRGKHGTLTQDLWSIDSTGNFFIPVATASTTKTSGALVVNGGVGIGGNLNVGGDVKAFATSDMRLKTNVKRIVNALDKVQSINGVEFNWTEASGNDTTVNEVGVLAQEIQVVCPEVVVERDNGFLAVRYELLIPLLIEAIKELHQEVQEVKAR